MAHFLALAEQHFIRTQEQIIMELLKPSYTVLGPWGTLRAVALVHTSGLHARLLLHTQSCADAGSFKILT